MATKNPNDWVGRVGFKSSLSVYIYIYIYIYTRVCACTQSGRLDCGLQVNHSYNSNHLFKGFKVQWLQLSRVLQESRQFLPFLHLVQQSTGDFRFFPLLVFLELWENRNWQFGDWEIFISEGKFVHHGEWSRSTVKCVLSNGEESNLVNSTYYELRLRV